MNVRLCITLVLSVAFLFGCSNGGDAVVGTAGSDTTPDCSGACASGVTRLSVADVGTIISQAIQEAQAQNIDATIAVTDRVGNVLGVYRMGDAAMRKVTIVTSRDANGNALISGGLEGISLPVAVAPVNIDDQAAIAKAVTGAYLSSEGNAFTTRTASQIVQDHFNPGEDFQPSGPLFGVQFSQLPCSDFSSRFNGLSPGPGPQRSPLGLSADPGGLPLYKNGTVVGGVGVIADGFYSIDPFIADSDTNPDELIAVAATFGFAAPIDRRADRITVEGKTFRYSDVDFDDLASNPSGAPALSAVASSVGTLIPVTGYSDGTIRAGTVFGQAESGIRLDSGSDFPGLDAFVFVDSANVLRYAPRAGTDAGTLGASTLAENEVRVILQEALKIASQARAQIRRPVSTQARVTISVVDTTGEVLGMVRSRDAPVFGADVSLQKARTAGLFSSTNAAAFLQGLPDAKYLTTNDTTVEVSRQIRLASYVTALRQFVANSNALSDGQIAFSDRAGGNLSRPFFPDGINGANNGPLSKRAGEWSPFSTGLQLDVSINAILQHVLFVAGVLGQDVGSGCAGVDLANDFSAVTATVSSSEIANGLQIFPGSVPIYRNGVLVGGIGVSGDGVDQDDMIAFLGLHNAGIALSTGIGNAPIDRRADTLTPRGTRLRYVQCPQAPFLNSDVDNVCDGK